VLFICRNIKVSGDFSFVYETHSEFLLIPVALTAAYIIWNRNHALRQCKPQRKDQIDL